MTISALDRLRLVAELRKKAEEVPNAAPLAKVGIARRMVDIMAQLEGKQAAPDVLPASIQAQIDALNAEYKPRLERAKAYDRLQNEGGEGYSTYEPISREHYAKLRVLQDKLFAAEWTADVTAIRREQWNNLVKAASARGEQWTGKDLKAAENQLGFTSADLRQAIALHKGGKPNAD